MAALSKRVEPAVSNSREIQIPLNKIVFDKDQPRSDFHHVDGQVEQTKQLSLEELAQSIRENGQIEPITVESLKDGTYRVLVGERRTRAHLMLGLPTIRASVNDSLVDGDPKDRLLFQLAENVNRDDLTEADMARNIQKLMKSENGSPAMTQTQIAKKLGKSEGWVSRYVRYGDEELQRLWVETGIADTVENLYRISVLPKHVQVDVQRRVLLDESDPEFLPRPLPRAVIDGLGRDAKAAKKAGNAGLPQTQSGSVPAGSATASSEKQSPTTESTNLQSASKDEVAERLAQLAAEGQQGQQQDAAKPVLKTDDGAAYTLSEQGRADILKKAQVAVESSTTAQPPVSVRLNMASFQKLLETLEPAEVADLNAISLSLTLPGPLAHRIANTLAGVIVDPTEVPSVVQNEMAKL
jgi:ParB/RepB/Spo0J family partition protein